ncbi:MAG: COX15/CtaA family protein, partial [Burkholderiaceae bacterium]
MSDPTPVWNLAPIVRLALLGLILAAAPLAWVWLRHRDGEPIRRLRALTLVTLFHTFDLVLFGAFTRLTDSGLGCPDWPGCYGSV